MAMTARVLVALLLAAMVVACSADGIAPSASPASLPGARDADKGSIALRIRIPEPGKARYAPRYVSAATRGLTIAFNGAKRFTKVFNLTPSDPRCVGSPLTCTIELGILAGHYAAVFTTYDRAPVKGAIPAGARILSTARLIDVSIVPSRVNHLAVTLGGVIANIVVGGFPVADAGTGFLFKGFTVTAKDADGYVIVGNYAHPITLTDSDVTGATGLTTAGSDDPPHSELLSSTDTAAISYTGLAIAPVTIRASAGAVTGSGVFAVQLPVYVADSSNDAIKEIPAGCGDADCVATLFDGFPDPYGIGFDRSGNMYVSEYLNNVVKQIPSGCLPISCAKKIGGGFIGPASVAVTAGGYVFVTDEIHGVVKEIPPGCVTAGCVTTLGGSFDLPFGIAVDRFGNAYVTDLGSTAVSKIPSGCYVSTCVVTVGGGFSGPSEAAVDYSGNVFVTDGAALKKIPPGCATSTCVTVIGGGFTSLNGVAVDVAGNVYVADFTYGISTLVKKVPPGCLTLACVTTLGGSYSELLHIAIPVF